MPLDRRLATLKSGKTGLYHRSRRLRSRTTRVWSIRIEEKNLAVGFRRPKTSCHSRPRTLKSETIVLSSRSKTFKRGKVAEIGIR